MFNLESCKKKFYKCLSLQTGSVASLIPATAQKQPIESLMRLSSGREEEKEEREEERERGRERVRKDNPKKEGRFITKCR